MPRKQFRLIRTRFRRLLVVAITVVHMPDFRISAYKNYKSPGKKKFLSARLCFDIYKSRLTTSDLRERSTKVLTLNNQRRSKNNGRNSCKRFCANFRTREYLILILWILIASFQRTSDLVGRTRWPGCREVVTVFRVRTPENRFEFRPFRHIRGLQIYAIQRNVLKMIY